MTKILFERSFASMEESKYWDDELNGDLKPENVSICGKKKVWLKCPNSDHKYQIFPSNIYHAGSGCPYPCCKGKKKLCNNEECKICFEASFASHEKSKYWNYELNGNKTPRDIYKSTDKFCYFNCQKSGHVIKIKLNCIADGNWCSYPCCANQKLCGKEECKTCFEASFASSKHAKQWDYVLNDSKPIEVHKYSNRKFWFICEKSGHFYNGYIGNVTNKGTCSYPCCVKEGVKLCGEEDCKTCFEASFASSKYCKYWDYEKNKETPYEVSKSSNKEYWFKCKKHEFKKEIYRISRGNLCGFKCCDVNSQVLCNDEKCEECFSMSFASVPQVEFLNNELNGDIKPRNITKFSHKRAHFKCKNGHEFNSFIYCVTKGNWCPSCKNKSETECREIIEKLTNKKFNKIRLKILNGLELDGYNRQLNLGFEYQGIQHYTYHPNFFHDKGKHIFIEQQLRDEIKRRLCRKNNIKLIVIPYFEDKEKFIKNELMKLNLKN